MRLGLRTMVAGLALPSGLGFTGAAVGQTPVAADCLPLEVTERGGPPLHPGAPLLLPRIAIEAPGRYCLDQDVHQQALRDALRGTNVFAREESMIRIAVGGVTLDLANHTVSNAMPHGLVIIWFHSFSSRSRDLTRFTNTRIANGRLVSPWSNGIGIDLTRPEPYGPLKLQVAPLANGARLSDVFEDTRHVVESMTIRAGKRGIQLDGANNVIRRNHIIVDGTTAIVAQGPGIVIEDNLIEVRNELSGFIDYYRDIEARTPFPIRLIQADGAIVRNNEIRFAKGVSQESLPAAVELIQSQDVLLEGNRFANMNKAVRADARSDFREVDNGSPACPWSALRFLPPEESAGASRLRLAACR